MSIMSAMKRCSVRLKRPWMPASELCRWQMIMPAYTFRRKRCLAPWCTWRSADTLTLSRAEMQLYSGGDERYESDLSVKSSAIIGLPMPADDLTYRWSKLMSVLQASLLHLDVVAMAGMHDTKTREPVKMVAQPGGLVDGSSLRESSQGLRDCRTCQSASRNSLLKLADCTMKRTVALR